MRVLGVDYGRKRLGLAVSDASGTLARPWQTLPAGSDPKQSARAVAEILGIDDEVAREVGRVVVGLPRRLNGTDSDVTAAARTFAAALGAMIAVPVVLQDERLSSHEAESLLARREPDWRARKARLDAAAAAVILQDHLDSHGADDKTGTADSEGDR